MRDITLNDTIYIKFTTRAFATGIPTTLSGTPVISAYEDNNLTQITAGISLTVDFDSVTGLNEITIAATAANGFEAGKSYALVITAGTVDGVSVVGEVVGEFTIESSAAAVDLANGTDGLGAIKTETATILVDTNSLNDTKIPDTISLANINAECDTALNDYDPPTRAELTTDKNEIITDLDDIKGTGFVKDTHSMKQILDDVTGIDGDSMRGTDSAYTGTPPTVQQIRQQIDTSSSQLSAIISDTNELQTDWADGGRLDTIMDSCNSALTSARGEPGQGAPSSSTSTVTKIDYLYKLARNKIETTTSEINIYNDAGTVIDHKSAISDTGTTATRGEFVSGA